MKRGEKQEKKELKGKYESPGGKKMSCRRKLNNELDSSSSSDEDLQLLVVQAEVKQ